LGHARFPVNRDPPQTDHAPFVLATEFGSLRSTGTARTNLSIADFELRRAQFEAGVIVVRHVDVNRPLKIWHHDILHPDGSPYSKTEVDLIRKLTAPGTVAH
jgi:hypothetical protein